MRITKYLVAVPLVALLSAGGIDDARAADPVETCEKGIALKISGQVNRAVLYADDHENRDDFFVVDNDNSSSRVRWKAKGHIDCDWTIGITFEVEWESNSTADIEYDQTKSAASDRFKERKIEWWVKGPLGTILVGQGDTASNGTSEVDLSRTGVVAYSAINDFMGNLDFGLNGGGGGSGIKIEDVWSNFDGLSRRDRVRYDTPSLAGFKLSTSYTDRGHWDVALRYAGEFGGFRVAAAAAYVHPHDNRDVDYRKSYNGSISIRHDSGLNLTFAAGKQKDYTDVRAGPDTDPKFWYVKLGWLARIFSMGRTAFSVDYGQTRELDHADDKAKTWGVAVVQSIKHVGAEFYLAVRDHKLNASSDDVSNQWGIMSGARVKF
jgi:hypothetical protein